LLSNRPLKAILVKTGQLDGYITRLTTLNHIFATLTVNIWKTTNQKFKLFVVKDRYQLPWNEFIKPFQEGINLRPDCSGQSMLCYTVDIFMLILLSNPDVTPSRNQLTISDLQR
jgi:hypothetical protein